MVGLAMSMFGFYEIRIPMKLAGMAGTAKQGAAGAFAMGLTVGIVAAPCIGPFVLGLLTFVGEQGDPLLGFSLFFTLALGLGAPYVFLAIASGNISRLPKSGEWMEWIRRLFGVILIGMAVYFLNPVLGDKTYWILLAAVAIVGGIWLGWILKLSSSMIFVAALRRVVGLALPALGIYLLVAPGHIRGADTHGIPWLVYDDDLLVEAKAEGQPVVIDFTAEWCLPCQELDHETFADATVMEAAKAVVPLRADLTRSAAEEVKELREKYGIVGVPTVVFIGADGRERTELRVVQFIEADEFLERLAKLTGEPLQVDARAP
jgi:thiol:disulfide interchange protein DsbD